MRLALSIGGAICGIGLIILSLWYWREAPDVAAQGGAGNTNLAIYSVRFAAVAGIAAAQILLLTLVIARVYRFNAFDSVMRRAAGVVFVVSLACAVAFALMAR